MMRIKERSQFVLHKKEREKKDAKCEINKIWYTQAIVVMHICTVTVARCRYAQF